MDPTIMKLLEDDEDETMHSGADVEALTAALNRDIGRTDDEISQDSGPSTAVLLSQGSNSASSPLPGQWQTLDEEINRIQRSEHLDTQQSCYQEQESSQRGDMSQHSGSQDICSESDIPPEKGQCSSEKEQPQIVQQQQQHHLLPHQHSESESARATEQGHTHIPEKNPSHVSEEGKFQISGNQPQYHMQSCSNQQGQSSDQSNAPMRRMKLQSIPFHSLIPILRPHLDKDRTMQLNNVFAKLKSKEIGRDDFLRVIRNIVGDQMLRQAAHKMMQQQAQQAQVTARNSQSNQTQLQTHNQTASQLPLRSLPHGPHLNETRVFSQLHPASTSQFQTGQAPVTTSTVQMHSDSQLNGKGIRSADVVPVKKENNDSISLPVVNSQQTHALVPPSSFHMPGAATGNFGMRPFSRPVINNPAALMSQAQGSVFMQNTASDTKRLQGGFNSQFPNPLTVHQNQIPWHQSGGNEPQKNSSPSIVSLKQEPGESNQPQFVPQKDIDAEKSASSSKNETVDKQSARLPTFTSNVAATTLMAGSMSSTPETVMPRAPSGTPQTVSATTVKTPQKKPSVGQKKPLDSQSTPPASSKKQKTSGAFQDQSIEQLNDVTAVSGVNLREEEEQLLAAPKEETRASEAARKAVQEEEERLILHKSPLQKKITEIMSKSGIKNVGSDVNRCLSMCVEERLRGIINSLVRVSKKRMDVEKARHQVYFTSDVHRQIMEINQKAKDEWEKKQAEEADKLKKPNDTSDGKVDTEKDKDETRPKAPKMQPNKEEDDKMRTTAANVAARVAVGGDDMLSKWQLMAEQARQKREGSLDSPSATQTGKLSGRKVLHGTGRISKDNQDGEKKSSFSGGKRGRNATLQEKMACNITIKDVIAVLEREHQMSKSTLLYRLYDRISSDQTTE